MSDSEWQSVTSSKKQSNTQSQSLSQRSALYHQQRQQQHRRGGNKRHHGHFHHGHHGHQHQHSERQEKQTTHVEKQDQFETESVDSNAQKQVQKEVNRKTIQEFGWTDIKQLRRMIAHLETIANYSQGGIIGSLRGNCIHNAEDREQQIRPVSEVRITEQENAFLKHLATYCDNEFADMEEVNTLLGFQAIILASIAQLRYSNEITNNYDIYHESFDFQVWKSSSIPSNLTETLKRDLQQKYETSPPALDSATLQDLLLGKTFKFEYDGCLSLPYCLDVLREHVNCQEAKVVRQRRSLYKYEPKQVNSTSRTGVERSVWRSSQPVYKARDYKSQVEAFELQYLEGQGIPVSGATNLASILHAVYTSFLKIRKEQTPRDLLERLKILLKLLPNLIFLPELLQSATSSNWAGYASLSDYPDLPDYEDLKIRLKKLLERDGVKPTSGTQNPVQLTLQSIYNFNRAEGEKFSAYLEQVGENNEQMVDAVKGYPLNAQYIFALIKQLGVTEKTYKKEIEQLLTLSELEDLKQQL